MSTKKISELSTKSFLGGAGAAANSYVLINYEDNSTSEPITYKATIQELGKAIANDLQLYKKTQDGAVTTSVNNGAYVDGSAKDFIELDTPKNVQINRIGDLGYFTATDSDSWVSLNTGVSEGYVTNAISGLASTGDVTNAVSGLASTGYVTAAVANAGGGGFDPTEPITCEFAPYGINASDTIEGNLYPVMTDGYAFYQGDGYGIKGFVPLDKILFYEIEESEGEPSTLLLKARDNTTIHSIPLN